MTTDDSFYPKKQPVKATVFFDGLIGIFGAGRSKPADFIRQKKLAGKAGMKKRRFLIKADEG